MNMKRKYLSPEVEVDLVVIERNILSDPYASSAQDLIYDDEENPWQ